MSWDGKERRTCVVNPDCKFEGKIMLTSDNVIEIKGDVKALNTRINGALDKIAMHVEEGTWYRRLIITTSISLVVAVISGVLALATLSYNLGQYTKQIQINTHRLDVVEQFHNRNVKVTVQ